MSSTSIVAGHDALVTEMDDVEAHEVGRRDTGPLDTGLLDVVVLHAADAEAAQAGGADRLEVRGRPDDGGRSAEPATVSSVVRATDLPVRVVLRLSDGYTTTGGEAARLIGLASDYLAVGAEGVVLGFLDANLELDLQVIDALVSPLRSAPWTLSRAVDSVLDADRAWRQLVGLPGLTAVHTAGSALGLDAGLDDLCRRASSDPAVARLVLAGGGLRAEHVPWLVQSGVRQLHLAEAVRPGGTFGRSYVDAGLVRSWRLLLDDSIGRRTGRATS